MRLSIADLIKLFEVERDRFADHYPTAAQAELRIEFGECISRGHCKRRDFAYTDGRRVVVHSRILYGPRTRAVGLIRHELGHVCDPEPWVPGREQRADDIAEMVSGQKIRYDQHDIQTVGRGAWPRPKHLPK